MEQEQKKVKNGKDFQLFLKYQFKWQREIKAEIKMRKTTERLKEESSKSIGEKDSKNDEKDKELKFEKDILSIFNSALSRKKLVDQNLKCSLDKEEISKL